MSRPTYVAVDLTDADGPGASSAPTWPSTTSASTSSSTTPAPAWRGEFADVGYANVKRHMDLNFDAPVRLTEALLPLLRRSAPSAIVNVASTAGRVARAGSASYSASKFALIGWTDGLALEEAPHGVHVGTVMPGFVSTEGFPQAELQAKALTRLLLAKPATVADAIWDAGPGGKSERYVPRPYGLAAALRILAPGLVRRVLRGGVGKWLTTATGSERSGL